MEAISGERVGDRTFGVGDRRQGTMASGSAY